MFGDAYFEAEQQHHNQAYDLIQFAEYISIPTFVFTNEAMKRTHTHTHQGTAHTMFAIIALHLHNLRQLRFRQRNYFIYFEPDSSAHSVAAISTLVYYFQIN